MGRTLLASCFSLVLSAIGTSVFAQPGPFTTLQNNDLLFAVATLTTNSVPGLTNPPAKLMVSTVATNSAQGGRVAFINTVGWAKRYNGPANNEDQGMSVVADGDGNVFVAGISSAAGTGRDFLTIKYAPDGMALWTNRYDGPEHGTDTVRLAAVDGAGNVYVTGESGNTNIVTVKYSASGAPVWTNRYATSPGGFILLAGFAVDKAGNTYVLPYDGDVDAFITLKYGTTGIPAWTNYFKGSLSSLDNPVAVAVDEAGNVFVTGDSFNGGSTIVTLKYATDGTCLWTNKYNFVGLDSAAYMAVDRQGNVIVTGISDGGTPQQQYGVVEFSNDGALLWTNAMPSPAAAGAGVPIVVADPVCNVFLTGRTPSGSASSADFTTVKYSTNGTPLWTNRFIYPSSNGSWLHGTAADSAGNFFLTCESSPLGANNADYAAFKCSGDGTPVWTNRYNGPANTNDLPRSITTDFKGNVYVTGTSAGSGTGFGALDVATVKYTYNIRYWPPTNFTGLDTFAFTAVDYLGNSATGVVTVAVLPLILQFNTNLQFTAQGMQLQVDGAHGTNQVVIYASTDLLNWDSISTNPPVLGSVQFLDSAATNLPHRFYRAIQQ